MLLDGSEDGLVLCKPAEIGTGAAPRSQPGLGIELCVGDRIRGPRNDGGSASSIARPEVTAAIRRAGDVSIHSSAISTGLGLDRARVQGADG